MILNKTIDLTTLITTSICVFLVIMIFVFGFVFLAKRRSKSNDLRKDVVINPKIFKNTLNDFFTALGGTKNVNKIEYNEDKKCLVVYLEDTLEAKKLDILSNYNMYKKEFFEDRIELYFPDSKAFYDSLFGK